jgi:hypothetical protein
MRIYINRYRNHWISPYTILEKIFFWREIDYDEPIIKKWNDRLTPLCLFLKKVCDVINPKIDYVKIDRWDTWSMDHTLSQIILPMLKQLNESKHGSPIVELEDVPEHLRNTGTQEYEEQSVFDFYREDKSYDDDYPNIHARWDWVLGEMIFAFEHIQDESWQEKFFTGVSDWQWEKLEETMFNPITGKEEGLSRMIEGPNHTHECDYDGMRKVEERIQNGLVLFGKYYKALWD